VDGAAAGAVEPVGEAEGEEGAEEEGEDDGVVGWHFVHFCVREVGVRCWVFEERDLRLCVELCE
jgi:hypothetical protein